MSNERNVPEYIEEGDGFNLITLDKGKGSITMREPCALDLKNARQSKKDEVSAEFDLFGNLCSLTPDEVGKLSVRNYGRLKESFALFMD